MSTDKDWEKWGSENPFFGVLSDPKFIGSDLKAAIEEEFYRSGQNDIRNTMRYLGLLGGNKFKYAVDFGCGTGRLTIPLASYAKKVTGVDISHSVLNKAKEKTPKKLSTKISYIDLTTHDIPKNYDFVHSFIVLQHIPPRRGKRIITDLLTDLQPGGFAALHITYANNTSRLKKMTVWLRNHIVPLHIFLNIIKGRRWNTPRMRMHLYDLEEILQLYNNAGITETLQIATDHGGYIGAMILGKKQSF